MARWRITICKICGSIYDEGIEKFEDSVGKCRKCGGDTIPIDLSFGEARKKYANQIDLEFGIQYSEEDRGRFAFYRNKLIRDEYFYGKLDDEVDKTLLDKTIDRDFDQLFYFNAKPTPQVSKVPSNVPKCPSCGSTNLQKLSGVGKVARVSAFGLFGTGNLGKTYKCRNCGIRF